MVDTTTLIVGIITPIIVGPITLFLKSFWDRFSSHKEEVKKNRYDAKLNDLNNKINLFYWPVYLKLKCLDRLNYKRKVDSDYSDNDSNSIYQEKKTRKFRKKIKRETNNFSDTENLSDKENLSNIDYASESKNQDYYWDDDIHNKIMKKFTITEIDLADDSDIISDSNILEDDNKKYHKFRKISVNVDSLFLKELDKKIIEISYEVKELINANISILQPDKELVEELVKFVRFVEMETVVFNANNTIFPNEKKKFRKYNYLNMGVINNTKKLYQLIKIELDKSINEYKEIFNEYNSEPSSSCCTKK